MANRTHLRIFILCFGFAAAFVSPARANPTGPTEIPPADRGVVREEIPVYANPSADGLRSRRLPLRVPPPVEEIVVFQDSLNALTISNQGGWTHFDNSAKPTAWHRDTFLGCQGTAWWCGRIDSTWIYDTNRAGYENSWTQSLENGVWLDSLPPNSTVRIAFRHHFNAEPGYDYGYVEFLDIDEGWVPIISYTGKLPSSGVGCDTAAVVVPDSIITKYYSTLGNPDAHLKLPFRFRFKSDIAYSSQDGLFDGDGWVVDNITVRYGSNNVRFFDNVESGPGAWLPTTFPPVGDLFSIGSNVYTEDVCTTNRTNVWTDWDPTVFSVVPRQDNLLHTPAVFVNRSTQVFTAFDVYRNLPLYACFYYHLRYRTRMAGQEWSAWVDPTRLVYYGATKDWARQKTVLPGAALKDSVQLELALTDYGPIYCGGTSSTNGVYTFFDNVAIGVVATAGPIFVQRDVDLFNDTFQETAFFKDDNINTALGDSAAVEVSTSRGYKAGSMFYRINGGSWSSTPLLPASAALPRMRYADVPPGNYPANSFVEYYFSATDSTNTTVYLPAGAITDGTYFSASVLPIKSAVNPSLSCFDSLATVLFVNNFTNREPKNLWTDALKGLGYKFDVWEVNAPSSGLGNTPGGSGGTGTYDWPNAGVTALLQYSTIIWHAGNLNSFTLSQQDQALLQSWIQQSGKNRNLWIAGDNIANDLAGGQDFNSFMSFTGGISFTRNLWENFPQDTLHPVITGTAGGPASGRFFHANADCPLIDEFDLIAPSFYAQTSGKTGILLKYPNTFGAATRFATKYASFGSDSARTVWMGFNFGFIEEGGERLQFTRQVMQDYFKVAACYAATSVETDPAQESPSIRNSLAQNAPNPFNPSTTIRYSVAETGPVTIRVFNAGGALVRTLVDAPHAPGSYNVRWDGKDDAGRRLGSGVYFYRIETGSGFHDAKKLILVK